MSVDGAQAASPRWLLITGEPGTGKTTLVRRVCDRLLQLQQQQAGSGLGTARSVRGFYTEELRNAAGRRIGFDVVTIPEGRRAVLARRTGLPASCPRTGHYRVDVRAFEEVVLPVLQAPAPDQRGLLRPLIVVDEIGGMELHSAAFQAAVRALLANAAVDVLGTISSSPHLPLCDQVRAAACVSFRRISVANRDDVRAAVEAKLLHTGAAALRQRTTESGGSDD